MLIQVPLRHGLGAHRRRNDRRTGRAASDMMMLAHDLSFLRAAETAAFAVSVVCAFG
jgi:hypothetical protein